MPSTPTGTTHASFSPKREPVSAFATRSPMSTKPPMAVRMPRPRATVFFTSAATVVAEERLDPGDVALDVRHVEVVVPAPRRNAQRGDVVVGIAEDRLERVAHDIGAMVGWLDRAERAGKAVQRLLGLG